MTISIVSVISEDLSIVHQSKDLCSTLEHDSLKIWISSNSWFWFSRNIGGSVEFWLKYYRNYNDEQVEQYLEQKTKEPSIQDVFKNTDTHEDLGIELRHLYGKKEYHPYIASRNVNEETAKYFGLESTKDNIIFPVYDFDGQRIGAILRNIHTNDKTLKYRKWFLKTPPLLWPMFYWHDCKPDDLIFVGEGAWYVMRFWQVLKDHNIKCFGLFGTATNEDLLIYLNGLRNVNFILDNDETGKLMAQRLKKLNPTWRRVLPSKYPDEMTDKEIINFVKKVKKAQ